MWDKPLRTALSALGIVIGVGSVVALTSLGNGIADVLFQFLFEAVLLAVSGGLAGVALGVGASALLPALVADLPAAAFATNQIALAFGVSAPIGALFGSLPAYRSARLAPVEAPRREQRSFVRTPKGAAATRRGSPRGPPSREVPGPMFTPGPSR